MARERETRNQKPETGLDWSDLRFKLRLTALGVAVLLLLVFITLNFDRVTVWFFFMNVSLPLSILILGSALIGAGLMWGFLALRGFLRK